MCTYDLLTAEQISSKMPTSVNHLTIHLNTGYTNHSWTLLTAVYRCYLLFLFVSLTLPSSATDSQLAYINKEHRASAEIFWFYL